jgi:hypothetical protein
MIGPTALRAQSVDMYFPAGVGGYDQQLGVTVQSRSRPQYATPGVQVGSFMINPQLDQSVLYNSNPTGTTGVGTWGTRTSGSVSAGSLWSRDSLGMSLGFDNFEYFSLPGLDHTNWNVGLGGGYTIGDSQLVVAFSHQSTYQLSTGYGTTQGEPPVLTQTGSVTGTVQTPILGQTGTTLGTVMTQTPILDQTDTAQASYTFNLSRFSVTPDVSLTSYRFGTATILGTPLNQQYLDHTSLAGGVTTRYSMSDVGGLLVVIRGIDNNYSNPQPGVPSNDSQNFMLLGGIDYQPRGVWRYRLLAGVELTTFSASQYGTTTSPVVQGSIIWSPTGLITVTGSLTRSVAAPQSAGTNGFVLTSGKLVGDYEFRRNILLQGRGGIQYAQYLQGGAQTSFSFGGGASWLLNRNLRLSLDYDATQQSGTTNFSTSLNPNTLVTGHYDQSLVALTLHAAL